MKRHPVLQDLSRDHHSVLVLAHRLRTIEAREAMSAREAFRDYWSSAGERHFRIEEEVLLPALAKAGRAEDPVVSRVLYEHARIRLLALRLCSGLLSPSARRGLGELLSRHVRLEEHELFPLVEAALSPAARTKLGSALSRAERRD